MCIEFGCGVGRVSVPLASLFKRVHALDISKTHLAMAERRASEAGVNNVEFILVDREILGSLPSADSVYSRLVLQHNPPPIIALLLQCLLKTLKVGEIAIIQIPT